MNNPPIVYLIDDSPEFEHSLTKLASTIGLKVVRFRSADEFLNTFQAERSSCVMIGLGNPELQGIRVLDELAKRPVSPPAVVLIDDADVSVVVRAARHGVVEFLEKGHSADSEVLDGIQKALSLDQQQRQAIARRQEIRERFDQLKSSEMQVLELLLQGDELLTIAQKLNVSRRTVDVRRELLMKQLGVNSFPELVALAAERDSLPALQSASCRNLGQC